MDQEEWLVHLDPLALFEEYTYIENVDVKRIIERHCIKNGYIPMIDYHEGVGAWLWHTLYKNGTEKYVKPVAEYFDRDKDALLSEKDFVDIIVARLQGQGILVDVYVRCSAGEADIVTKARDVVFEVKPRLTRGSLFRAVGQVLVYRQSINPEAR